VHSPDVLEVEFFSAEVGDRLLWISFPHLFLEKVFLVIVN
jgi:hypothetical protein